MKRGFLTITLLLIAFSLRAETTNITGKLEVNKKTFFYGESIEFTYTFYSSSKSAFNINTPVFENEASFGVGIILKNQKNEYYKFIRTPFWHYMLPETPIDFSKSEEVKLKYIHNPNKDHCRIIKQEDWVDNSPKSSRKGIDFEKGDTAFKNAIKSIPAGKYAAWIEVSLTELPKLNLSESGVKKLEGAKNASLLKTFFVKSKPIEF